MTRTFRICSTSVFQISHRARLPTGPELHCPAPGRTDPTAGSRYSGAPSLNLLTPPSHPDLLSAPLSLVFQIPQRVAIIRCLSRTSLPTLTLPSALPTSARLHCCQLRSSLGPSVLHFPGPASSFCSLHRDEHTGQHYGILLLFPEPRQH